MKRRDFLGVGLAAAALPNLPSTAFAQDAPLRLNYPAMRTRGWRLCCQAWTFREMTAFETIDVVRGLGIRNVEFFPGQKFSTDKPDAKLDHNSPDALLDELKAKLKEARITPVNYGVTQLGNDEASARKVFDFAKKLGLRTIVAEPAEPTVPMLDKLCEEYGINIAIHDHPKPSHYWDPDIVLKVCEGRSKRIGSCSDTGHWFRSGLVPVDCLKKLEGRIISLHFKDLDESKKDVPWGTGLCNAHGMLAELKRQGVKPVISIEYEHGSGAELQANVRKCVEWFDKQATEFVAK